MHTTRDYSELSGEAKAQAAIEDTINYLGAVRFLKVVNSMRDDALKSSVPPLSFFIGCCEMFLGISGYPTLALYNHIYVENKTEADLDAAHKALLANAVNEGEG